MLLNCNYISDNKLLIYASSHLLQIITDESEVGIGVRHKEIVTQVRILT